MKADELTPKHIEDIIQLYTVMFSPSKDYSYSPEKIIDDIKKNRIYSGYVLGFQWSRDALLSFKLDFQTRDVLPFSNVRVPRESELYGLADRTNYQFKKLSAEYLNGVSLEDVLSKVK